MAVEVEIAKNSLDALSEASEQWSKFTAVTRILGIAGQLTSTFPYVGDVLVLNDCSLPDSKRKEILQCFEKLSNKIDQTKLKSSPLQYKDAIDRIKSGMKFCVIIGKATGRDEKIRAQEILKNACANQAFTSALGGFLDGIAGNGLFAQSILDEFYNETNGNREKISALAIQLLQLVCGGMMVMATYETVVRGVDGAKEETKRCDPQFKKVNAKVQSVLDKCEAKFQENM